MNKGFAEKPPDLARKGRLPLARRLAIALWRYLEHGEIPAGAILKPTM
ncbi:hypothetical protein SB861_40770 [Paraburkholderia sp. SIMBA_049]